MDEAIMENMTDGGQYRLPNGIPVTARRTDLPDLTWELTGPGGWGTWIIDESGAILTPGPTVRKRPTLRPTNWTKADLVPDGTAARLGASGGSV